jgi:hypothetical protein
MRSYLRLAFGVTAAVLSSTIDLLEMARDLCMAVVYSD